MAHDDDPYSELKTQLGQRIRALRRARSGSDGSRMTIEELARGAGLSKDYVNRLELGQYQPTVETMMRLAGALDVAFSELIPLAAAAIEDEKSAALQSLQDYLSAYRAEDIRYVLQLARVALQYPDR